MKKKKERIFKTRLMDGTYVRLSRFEIYNFLLVSLYRLDKFAESYSFRGKKKNN